LREQQISSVGIAQTATLAHKPASPNKMLIIAGFSVLGLGFCVALIGLKEFSRKTFRHAEELERFGGYPVLAEIPKVSELVNHPIRHQELPSNRYQLVRSACNLIQSELLLTDSHDVNRSMGGLKLGVVGIHDGIGASLTAMTLAKLHSESSFSRTILLDLDTKNSTVAQAFNAPKQNRVFRLFPSQAEAPVPSEPAPRELSNLDRVADPAPLASVRGNHEQTALSNLQSAAAESDFVVIDFPPMSRSAAALGLMPQMDQVLVIVQAEETSAEALARAIRQIERAGGNIVGLVLNQTPSYVPRWIRKLLA
jgi:succinoglycan biosynthesis transport protein ExoP